MKSKIQRGAALVEFAVLLVVVVTIAIPSAFFFGQSTEERMGCDIRENLMTGLTGSNDGIPDELLGCDGPDDNDGAHSGQGNRLF